MLKAEKHFTRADVCTKLPCTKVKALTLEFGGWEEGKGCKRTQDQIEENGPLCGFE